MYIFCRDNNRSGWVWNNTFYFFLGPRHLVNYHKGQYLNMRTLNPLTDIACRPRSYCYCYSSPSQIYSPFDNSNSDQK